jgi:hypothetical protein
MAERSSGVDGGASRRTSRSIFGALPNNTSSGRSTGRVPCNGSTSTSTALSSISPITANGQRSRRQMAAKSSSFGASIHST